MKILVTGANGFVAPHLIRAIKQQNEESIIVGIGRSPNNSPLISEFICGDLRDLDFITKTISEVKPDAIIHLASQSSVSDSWIKPNYTFNNNVNIFLNLLDAVKKASKNIRILSIGSSEEYGSLTSEIKLKESDCLKPTSPYAVARVAQTNLACLYAKNFEMDIVCTRSFNHYGIGQRHGFVIADFMSKVIQYKLKGDAVTVGNLEIIRDFVNVADVVDAYLKLLFHGKTGEIYNVCAGVGYRLKDILTMIFSIVGVDPNYQTNISLLRPNENNIIIGDNTKITTELCWMPKIKLNNGIEELYDSLHRQ